MNPFLHGHATHPDARMALALAAAQVEAQLGAQAGAPTLGWLYLSDRHAAAAEALLADVQRRWPGVAWVGAVGVGVSASGVEYFDEPGLVLMLAALPNQHFRVFSGALPLGDFAAHTAQVHADPATPDLGELIDDMSERTRSGYLFGGLASARTRTLHIAEAVLQGGLSGVAFTAEVPIVSRVTQGCQPIGPQRRITAVQRNVIHQLDGEPALDCLLRDLNAEGAEPRDALPRLRQTLVGLSDPKDGKPGAGDSFRSPARSGSFGSDTRVRHLVGLDPAHRGIAIADNAEPGQQLAFCTRDTEAARRDLMRICAEIRDELEPTRAIAGAVYVSCAGRGGPHFGAPSAELAIVRHALGDVPLAGFFAAGEIARHHLYGYTGVLTVFPHTP